MGCWVNHYTTLMSTSAKGEWELPTAAERAAGYRAHARLNRQRLHNLPWYERVLDRLAFWVMDAAGRINRRAWSKQRRNDMFKDGWTPARYV